MKRNLNSNVAQIVPPLGVLRGEIDHIDDRILELLEQRYAVVRRITRAKAGETKAALPVRPRREKQIVQRLSAQTANVPAEDIAHIWRSILALSARSQRQYRLTLWAPEPARLALASLAAARFGSTVPIDWAGSAAEAIASGRSGQSIVLIPADHVAPSKVPELDLIGQYPLDCPAHPWALAMGRLTAEATVEESPSATQEDWTPSSWRGRVHHQLPAYRDPARLKEVEARLRGAEPVAAGARAAALRTHIAEAQSGHQMILQAGDCAEPIDASRADTLKMSKLISALAGRLEQGAGLPVIRVGRMAGQFAKPRSVAIEPADGALLPVYRGDAVNQQGSSPGERAADPARLHDAYEQSCRVDRWLDEGHRPFTSHEALLLPYEAALTRRDPDDGRWWARSADSLWLGERTRDPSGAHVEYLRGVTNAIGIKCGPGIDPDQLLLLLDRIDAQREPGRIMLIARMGHDRVADRLGPLMAAVKDADHPVLWMCDPMHGNNRSIDGVKTRLVPDLIAEVEQFVAVARSEGVHPGGLHLETTPDPVVECVDTLAEAVPQRCYQSRCDPRLNAEQAMRVVDCFVAALDPAQ